MADEAENTTPDQPATGDLGDAGKKALEAERRDRRAAEKRAADFEARLKEFEDRDKTESTRAIERAEAAETAAAAGEARALRLEVAGSGPLAVKATIQRRGGALNVDFTGTADQVKGPVNTNLAVTTSAVFYVVAAVVGREIPANQGMMAPVRIRAPEGSIVNCRFPAAVAGGNVETSQRIVDVLLRALAAALPDEIPAASCGTMTNLSLGGYDPVRERPFSYYETVGGGCGGGPRRRGASALQPHMTNTFNTPVEVLEAYYPLQVRRYAVRRGSGGVGVHPGGDGIDREIRVLAQTEMTLLSERR